MQLHTHITNSLKMLSNGVVDLIYPPLCLICEQRLSENETQLCNTCLACIKPLNKAHEKFSVPGEIHLRKAWALFEFDSAFQGLIHHLKYSKRRKPVLVVLNHFRQEILSQIAGHSYDWVISIPLHPRKLRERGYNQVDGMTNWVADCLTTSVGNHLVKRKKYTMSQTTLNASQRQENVRDAFTVIQHEVIEGSRILLVDDVLTTGATANGLAQKLMEAGANQIDLVTLSTPEHGTG